MSRFLIYHNPRCSKSREALSFLQSQNVELEVVEYLQMPPTETQLLDLLSILEGPIEKLVRIKDEAYQTAPFSLSTASEIAHHLSMLPALMERPLVVCGSRAVIARPLENIKSLLS